MYSSTSAFGNGLLLTIATVPQQCNVN